MPHSTRRHLHLAEEQGQSLAEYAILAGGIAIVVVVSLPFIASAVKPLFEAAAAAFGV